MVFVGFIASYINTCIYGEEENDDNYSKTVLVADLETIVSTNEAHRQHGRVINERSTKSQIYYQINNTPKKNPQTIMKKKQNSLIDNSGDEDDPNHPKRVLKDLTNYQ
jgi:hypothetical protein